MRCTTFGLWWGCMARKRVRRMADKRSLTYCEVQGINWTRYRGPKQHKWRTLWQKTAGPSSLGVGQEADYLLSKKNKTVLETMDIKEQRRLVEAGHANSGIKVFKKSRVRPYPLWQQNKNFKLNTEMWKTMYRGMASVQIAWDGGIPAGNQRVLMDGQTAIYSKELHKGGSFSRQPVKSHMGHPSAKKS